MCVPLWQSKLRRHSLPKITVRLTIQNLSQFRRVNEFIISTRHIWSPDLSWFWSSGLIIKKIVLKFPILCGYWRYHLIFFHPPRARVFLFRFLNEFCELVAHFPERSETFSVKAVVKTVKLLACITGALWTTQGNAECACYTHWMAECGNKHPGLLHVIARNSKGIMAAVDGALLALK